MYCSPIQTLIQPAGVWTMNEDGPIHYQSSISWFDSQKKAHLALAVMLSMLSHKVVAYLAFHTSLYEELGEELKRPSHSTWFHSD